MTVSLNDLPNLEQLPASLYFFFVDLVRQAANTFFCPVVPNLQSNPVQRTQRPETVFVYWHKLHLRPLSLGEPHYTGGSPPLLSQTLALLPASATAPPHLSRTLQPSWTPISPPLQLCRCRTFTLACWRTPETNTSGHPCPPTRPTFTLQPPARDLAQHKAWASNSAAGSARWPRPRRSPEPGDGRVLQSAQRNVLPSASEGS